MPKTAKDKVLLAGDVSTDLAELVLDRAKSLGWSKSKFVSHIFTLWEDLGCPGVHPNDANYSPPDDWISRSAMEERKKFMDGVTVSEDPPPLEESFDRFAKGDKGKRQKADVMFRALEKNPEAFAGMERVFDFFATSDLLKKNAGAIDQARNPNPPEDEDPSA